MPGGFLGEGEAGEGLHRLEGAAVAAEGEVACWLGAPGVGTKRGRFRGREIEQQRNTKDSWASG